MAKIYRAEVNVWHKKAGGLGHASMDIIDDERNVVYVSLWPINQASAKKKKRIWGSFNSYMPESYGEDCEMIEREADTVIAIHNLPHPTNSPLSFFRTHWKTQKWALQRMNCCTAVGISLAIMAGVKYSAQTWHGCPDPTDIIRFSRSLKQKYG